MKMAEFSLSQPETKYQSTSHLVKIAKYPWLSARIALLDFDRKREQS
jgi:hypothetical protein